MRQHNGNLLTPEQNAIIDAAATGIIEMSNLTPILFARADSIYKQLPGTDV